MSNKISTLIIKKLQGIITAQELEELEHYASLSEENRQMITRLTNHESLLDNFKDSYRWYRPDDLVWIKERSAGRVARMRRTWTIAATIALVMGGLLWLFFSEKKEGNNILNIPLKYMNATLKTSEWRIPLSNSKENKKYDAILQKMSLIKTDHQLVYQTHGKGLSKGFDTLETDKESLYSLLLPDSSIVWLNCASHLCYPSNFSDSERVVQLVGEAYFEVAKDARPFKVQTKGIEIRVFGTKFNVRAYQKEEVIRTTLLEGAIKINTSKGVEYLKEGEQAFVNHIGQLNKKKAGSIKITALAWKQNKFAWDNEPLDAVITDICNWYGLKPVRQGPGYLMPISATLNRSKPVDDVLKILEETAPVKFNREGNNLIIGRPH